MGLTYVCRSFTFENTVDYGSIHRINDPVLELVPLTKIGGRYRTIKRSSVIFQRFFLFVQSRLFSSKRSNLKIESEFGLGDDFNPMTVLVIRYIIRFESSLT